MKILVFDDTAAHRQSAILQLSEDHELTVVGTYDEAQKLLTSRIDYDRAKEIFTEKYGDKEPYKRCDDDSIREERMDYYDKAEEMATSHPDFDVVLTDLLVPASGQAQGGEGLKFVGQEMPLGTTIALYALCAGVKKVAVVTDMNHHHHPASAAFDRLDGEPCKLVGVNIICTNHVGSIAIDEETGELVDVEFLKSEEGKVKYPYPNPKDPWGNREGLSYGKDWKSILNRINK